MSFSGLKTAVVNLAHNAEQTGKQLDRAALAVSYTHLDVYKRQTSDDARPTPSISGTTARMHSTTPRIVQMCIRDRPCYDFTPIISPTLDSSFLAVRPPASGVTDSHGVTGGVYKARERIPVSYTHLYYCPYYTCFI